VPGGQNEQDAAPARLYCPEGHTAVAALVLPTGQANPARQVPLQAMESRPPTEGSNHVPPGHTEHDEAPGPLYCPGGQRNAVAFVDPVGQANPDEHKPLHVALYNPWEAGSYHVPAAQLLQLDAPTRLYRPGGHRNTTALADPAGHAYPAAQGLMHATDRAGVLLHVPPAHCVHSAAPSRLNVPAGHAVAIELEDPAAGHAKPAAQLLQLGAPTRLYRPGGHRIATALVDPAGHAYPAAQGLLHATDRAGVLLHVPPAHCVHSTAPSRLKVPAGHSNAMELEDPASGHAKPAAQLLQLDAPTRLYRPGGHRNATALVDPAGHAYPAAQGLMHATDRAGVLLHVPPAHCVHSAAPSRLNVPAGHAVAIELEDPASGHAKPAAQLLQLDAPTRLYRPGGHRNATALADPAGHRYPAGHKPLHNELFNAETDVLYHVPAGQAVQDWAPARL
jgi:hypothetical protein